MANRIWDRDPERDAAAAAEREINDKVKVVGNGLDHAARIAVYDAGDIDITKIPPRRFLVGTSFCRKFLSGLIGEGGAGKTAVRYVQYLAAATAKNLTGEHVHVRCRVLIVCLEDDIDEVRRRIAAAMSRHGLSPADVKGWLFYCTPRSEAAANRSAGHPYDRPTRHRTARDY